MTPLPTPPADLPDAELLAEYRDSQAGAGDPRENALAGEIERRGLDI